MHPAAGRRFPALDPNENDSTAKRSPFAPSSPSMSPLPSGRRFSGLSQRSTAGSSGTASPMLSRRSSLSDYRRDKSGPLTPPYSPSQMSSYSTRTDDSQRKLRSFSFTSCFIPRSVKSDEEETVDDDDVSVSVSSGGSSANTLHSSQSKVYRHKESSDETQANIRFSFLDISRATANFSLSNQIGDGGFGIVYRGKLRDGTVIAVKRGRKNFYEKRLMGEFKSEIEAFSKIEHVNLVRYLGFVEQGEERIVVMEYVSNGTLRDHLDGERGDGLQLATRLDIAVDVAHAITYLHTYAERPVIHRDIKSANILLTENFRAKVADFGFARFTSEDPDATHVSTDIKGTAGYLDPEYLKTYHLTEKSDVYSFGVVLLELMTGRNPVERERDPQERLTVRWVMSKVQEGESIVVMDPRIRRSPAANKAVERVLRMAIKCLNPERPARPDMRTCGEFLWQTRKAFREAEALHSASTHSTQRSA